LHATVQAWPHSDFVDDFPGGLRQNPRREVKLRVSLRFDLSSENRADSGRAAELIGETRNLSEIGLAVSVPSNRINHRYLNVVGCRAYLTLDLPAGPVQMQVTPRWCQKLYEEASVESYLVGLRITEMSDEEWVSLVRFVHASL
jgi:hypothetical protein